LTLQTSLIEPKTKYKKASSISEWGF